MLWLGSVLAIAACGGKVESNLAASGGAGGGISDGGTTSTGGTLATGGTSGTGATGGTVATGGSAGAPCVGDLSQNPDHCGYCGHSCLGGACVGGVCQSVVLQNLGNKGAYALAVDDGGIWWADPLQHMQKDGSGVTQLATTQSDTFGVAVDAGYVYWTNTFGGTFRVSKQGGAPESVGPSGYRVAVDDQYVYAAWQGTWKAPKGGGAPIYLSSMGDQGIALDDTYVYFTTWTDGGLWKVPKAGGSAVLLGKSPYSSYVAVWGDKAYWSSQGENVVFQVSKSGGDQVAIAKAATPYGIAADAAGVYWLEFDSGNIWMFPTGATAPILLASGQFYPRDLAVDATAVYWTNDASKSAVSKVAKP